MSSVDIAQVIRTYNF